MSRKAVTGIFFVIIILAAASLYIARPSSFPSPSSKTYTNATFGFALEIPAGFSVYPPDAATATNTESVLVFEKGDNAVQLVIMPFSGDMHAEAVTEEGQLQNKTWLMLPSGDRAMSFTGPGAFGPDMSNVWFVHNGYIYQMMSASSLGDTLKTIVTTIHFN